MGIRTLVRWVLGFPTASLMVLGWIVAWVLWVLGNIVGWIAAWIFALVCLAFSVVVGGSLWVFNNTHDWVVARAERRKAQ